MEMLHITARWPAHAQFFKGIVLLELGHFKKQDGNCQLQ